MDHLEAPDKNKAAERALDGFAVGAVSGREGVRFDDNNSAFATAYVNWLTTSSSFVRLFQPAGEGGHAPLKRSRTAKTNPL